MVIMMIEIIVLEYRFPQDKSQMIIKAYSSEPMRRTSETTFGDGCPDGGISFPSAGTLPRALTA
jgi:hypothetical protein